MLLAPCPYCGLRPEIEFKYAGEAHRVRPEDPSIVDARAWASYLFDRHNRRGRHLERWRHLSCGRFFNASRDTTTDAFLASYRIGEPPPDRAEPRDGE